MPLRASRLPGDRREHGRDGRALRGAECPTVVDEQTLIDAFLAGDAEVREVVLRAARMLGEGIAAMIAALNVNHVLIIGPATHLGPDYLEAVRRQAQASAPAAARAGRPTSSSARRAATMSSSALRRCS